MNRVAKIILLVVVIGPLAVLVFGGIVMLLWNNVLAEVLHISTVTFWQALGILVLAKILFGSFSGGRSWRRDHSWKHRLQKKWASMNSEEREQFKARWREGRWGYKPWEEADSSGQKNTATE